MLQERILKTLDKRDSLDQRKLAKIAGVNESSISRYLNGFESLNLPAVLKIVQFLFPEAEKEVMAEYVLTQKSRNARFALEYCDMKGMSDEVQKLIELLSVSVNPVDKEWAKLYTLLQSYHKQDVDMEELLMQVEVFDPKEVEMKIMKQILKGYIYRHLNDYNSLSLHTKYTELMIKQVKSEFLRNCHNIRLGLIKNYVCLYANDLEKARYYSHLILKQDIFENVKALAYHHLGHSYMLDDYKKSKEYLEISIGLFRKFGNKNNMQIAERKLTFLNSYWGFKEEFKFELVGHAEKSDYIYYLIQKGDFAQAYKILVQIDVESISDWDKAFHYYYLGILKGNRDLYYESVHLFRNAGDLFHINLPIEKLRKLGENEIVLKIFTS